MPTDQDRISLVERLQAWKPWLIGLAVAVIALLLAHTLRDLLAEFSYRELVYAIRSTGSTAMVLALIATLISYVALTGYDHSSMRYVGADVGYPVTAQTAFIAYALSNTIGLGVLTGGAVRMRLYGAAGVEAGKISRAIAFNAAAFTLGISVVGAAALLWGAASVGPAIHVPAWILRVVGAAFLTGAAVLLVLCRDGRERLHGPAPVPHRRELGQLEAHQSRSR